MDKDVDSLQKELDITIEELKKAQGKYELERKKYEEWLSRRHLADKFRRMGVVEAEIERLRPLYESVPILEKKQKKYEMMERYAAKRRELDQKIKSINAAQDRRDKQMDEKARRLQALRGELKAINLSMIGSKRCPLCNSILEDDKILAKEAAKKQKEIDEEVLRTAELTGETEEALEELAALAVESEALAERIAGTEPFSKDDLARAHRAEAMYISMCSELDTLKAELAGKEEPSLIPVQEPNDQEMKSLLVRSINLKEQIDTTKKIQSRISGIKQELSSSETMLGIYNQIADIFGKNGAVVYAINGIIAQVEAIANSTLRDCFESDYQVSLETEKMLKSGAVSDTLDIVVMDSGGWERQYESLSGGEKFKIDFSLRLALSKVLSGNKGTGVDTIIIDEGFGVLDDDGIEQMIMAIDWLETQFDLVVVITHVEKLHSHYDNKLLVEKNGVSTVKSLYD